jgi:hypothetical protein
MRRGGTIVEPPSHEEGRYNCRTPHHIQFFHKNHKSNQKIHIVKSQPNQKNHGFGATTTISTITITILDFCKTFVNTNPYMVTLLVINHKLRKIYPNIINDRYIKAKKNLIHQR